MESRDTGLRAPLPAWFAQSAGLLPRLPVPLECDKLMPLLTAGCGSRTKDVLVIGATAFAMTVVYRI